MRRSGNAEAAYVTWQACKNRFWKAWKAWRESCFCADKDLCTERFEFQISRKCLAVFRRQGVYSWFGKFHTQQTFNHSKTCGKKLGQWDCVQIWQLASNKRPSARNKKGYSLHCWIRTVRKKSTSNKKTQIFIHNSKAMEDIQKTDERTRKSTLLKTTSIITVSWRICISIRFVVEHIQWKMQNAICSMCNDEPGERGQQENQFCGAS